MRIRLPLWAHKILQAGVMMMLFLAVTVAIWAAPPAITSATKVDIVYDAAAPNDMQYGYRIVATEAASFSAAGLPPDAVVNTSTGWINGNRNTPGAYAVTVSASNADGTTTTTVQFSIHPAVLGVTSSRGSFSTGQSFDVTLHYNTAVVVSGAPTLTLAIGPAANPVFKSAVYAAGSGTSELVFRYTVSGGDADADGVQLLPGAPSGGLIAEANGVVAAGALPVKYFTSGITIVAGPGGTLGGPSESAATLTGKLANVSSRMSVVEGDANRSLITGFVVSGTAAKRVLLRAIGPTLGGFGVQGALADPRLKLYASSGALVADNDNWSGVEASAAATAVGAFALTEGARDSAAVVTLQPGAYTLVVMPNGGSGVALAEVYDADAAGGATGSAIINLSTRGYIDGETSTLIAGFAVKGTSGKRVLVRGIGPALAGFGVVGALSDPTLKIYQGDRLVAQNSDWSSSAEDVSAASRATGAFALDTGSKDAAAVLTLEPGAYTAVVSGAGGLAGSGLVEVYEVP
jgi:hypothetical protein